MILLLLACGDPCTHPVARLPDDASWNTVTDVMDSGQCVRSQTCEGGLKVIESLCESNTEHYYDAEGDRIALWEYDDTDGPGICNPETWGESLATCFGPVLLSPGCAESSYSPPEAREQPLDNPRTIEDSLSATECRGRGRCDVGGVTYELVLIPEPQCNTPDLEIFGPDGALVAIYGGFTRRGATGFDACLQAPLEPTDACGFAE